jgi:hypothetical protein
LKWSPTRIGRFTPHWIFSEGELLLVGPTMGLRCGVPVCRTYTIQYSSYLFLYSSTLERRAYDEQTLRESTVPRLVVRRDGCCTLPQPARLEWTALLQRRVEQEPWRRHPRLELPCPSDIRNPACCAVAEDWHRGRLMLLRHFPQRGCGWAASTAVDRERGLLRLVVGRLLWTTRPHRADFQVQAVSRTTHAGQTQRRARQTLV